MAEYLNHKNGHFVYRFYPGDTMVSKPKAPPHPQPGEEYKAILRQPLNGPCDNPELVLVNPLP